MFTFSQLVVLLSAILHLATCVLGVPVPFDDVEKAWKEGRSEKDIHKTELATPSFFHSSRSSDASAAAALQKKVTDYMDSAFEGALDERTMAARDGSASSSSSSSSSATAATGADIGNKRKEKRGVGRRETGSVGVVATVQGFMSRKISEWKEDGELSARGEEAPVLRPVRGRRWYF